MDYLEEHCGPDPSLRTQVERLLARLDRGTVTSLSEVERLDRLDSDLVGKRVSSYRLLEVIGEGGFGSVYVAEQEEPIRRKVALKIIKLGMDTRQVIARFEIERQALAMMEHPNIARIYDAGATNTGRPYFVMEMVRGVPITDYCDANSLSTPQRLTLFMEVCSAVQHAHQKGIIHRDIKPSNVMVTLHDGIPTPKIIDFGIAKAMSAHLTDKTRSTGLLQFIGTPEYMSPEQAEMSPGAPGDIDTRTDVYSLGALLYELLTGTTPFDAKTLRDVGYGEVQRIIRVQEPLTPSQRVSTLGRELTRIAESRRVEPQALSRVMRGDLDWIIMKALEKDRTRRYDSAAGLAMDIGRHLNNEPVLAGPPSAAYRIRKFVRRNRVSVVAGLLVTAALLIGSALATIGLIQASRERDRALLAEQTARREAGKARLEAQRAAREAESASAINACFNDLLASVDPMQLRMLSAFEPRDRMAPITASGFAHDVSVAEMVRLASTKVDEAFDGKPELRTTARETIGMTLWGLGLYDEAKPQLQAVLDIRRRTLGDDHPDTLRSMLALGELLLDAGKGAEAGPLVRSAFAGMRETYGHEHPRTLSCASVLASVLSDQGKYDESESVFAATLEAQRRVVGPEHRDTLVTMWKWSVSHLLHENLTDGPALARELHDISRRTLNPDDSLSILCKPLMGWWYAARYEYDQAEAVLRPGLEQCRRILGEEHPFTYMTMQGLARSLQGRDLQEEKEQLYREALAGLRATRGRVHWQTISTSAGFAHWLDEGGRFEEAEQQYRELLTDCLGAPGEERIDTLDIMARLADLLERRGKLNEAIAVRRDRLTGIQRRIGTESPAALDEMRAFAGALVRLGRITEGRAMTRQLLALRGRLAESDPTDPTLLGSYAWDLLTCTPADMRDPVAALALAEKAVGLGGRNVSAALDTLALAYHRTGDDDKAVETQAEALAVLPPESAGDLRYGATLVRYLLHRGDTAAADRFVRETVSTFRAALGEDNPRLAARLNQAGTSLTYAGHYRMAEVLVREALELNVRLLGEEHEQVAESLANLAVICHWRDEYEHSAQAYRRALAMRRRLLGDDHLLVVQTLESMGRTLHAGGDSLAAAPVLREAVEGYRRLNAEDVPAALDVKRDLACALTHLGSLDEAEPLIREALPKTRNLFGEEHWRTAIAMQILGWLLTEQGNADQAEPLIRKCVEVYRRLDIPEHLAWLPAQAESALGQCMSALQRFDEAEPLLLQAYDAIHTAKGDAYIVTRIALDRVIALYESWGKPEQAARWRAKLAMMPPILATEGQHPADSD